MDPITGRVLAKENVKSESDLGLMNVSIRHRKRRRQGKTSEEEFVWIPEPDPSKSEFGEPLSMRRESTPQNFEGSQLHEMRNAAFLESQNQRQTKETLTIVDIDHMEANNSVEDGTEDAKRFNYFLDFRGDVRGASSVQQSLYQNYLR